jgi:hypothetical protein
MNPEVKERLYKELMTILLMVEDRNNREAIIHLESLINQLINNKL